ncbi:hypothetical protein D3C72_1116310 [compost metagenome]
MVKATWIAVRPQWYLSSIGLTNSVQPYCMLAIIAMQITPKTNCTHGDAKRDVDSLCCSSMMSPYSGKPPRWKIGRL